MSHADKAASSWRQFIVRHEKQEAHHHDRADPDTGVIFDPLHRHAHFHGEHDHADTTAAPARTRGGDLFSTPTDEGARPPASELHARFRSAPIGSAARSEQQTVIQPETAD